MNLLPLITNLSTRNREYVIFVGAGFSKDAGIKSGWDILIETLKPIYIDENNLSELPENHYKLIEEWYINHEQYNKLSYSSILELMYDGDLERREYLKKFFINEKPGEAHKQLALMVANRFIRFIFTTNFDDLIEKALDELNLDYDVIYSDDILLGTKSWDKVETCRIYKLHGDYKTGRIRNTITELKALDPIIADDFQYIIDRHGLIVIGYSGRDEGVMNHFLKRKPYSYPFYWQYRNQPPQNNDFEYYHALIGKYKDEYKREVKFINCQGASEFLNQINSGIEKLERALLISNEKKYAYGDYISRNDSKRIRALSLDLKYKFSELYIMAIEKEDLDRFYKYKFEVFTEFLKDIQFIFHYFDELLNYSLTDEAEYFLQNIIKICSKDWDFDYRNEFMRRSTPYYLIMAFGSISLKKNALSIIDSFYEFKIRPYGESYSKLLDEIWRGYEGWDHIGKENYKKNYLHPMYSICLEHLLPKELVEVTEFNKFDAYITLYSVLNEKIDFWYLGCSMYSRNPLKEIYHEYIENALKTKDDIISYLTKLKERYEKTVKSDVFHGISTFIGSIASSLPKN
jgi:hypothetical protein